VVWSPDGSRLATIDSGGAVRLWDPVSAEELRNITVSGTAVAWSPDGSRLAVGQYDGRVEWWDPATGVRHGIVAPPGSKEVSALAWSLDGSALATGRTDGLVTVHNLVHGDRPVQLRLDEVIDIQWTRGGLAVAKSAGVTVLDVVGDPIR
jgi:WD40 repeat protein